MQKIGSLINGMIICRMKSCLHMTNCHKGDCSMVHKILIYIGMVRWWCVRCCSWHSALNLDKLLKLLNQLGFLFPLFSLLQSYFCMLSGEHRAICVFNDTCSCILVGEASKENVPEEVGLWLGLFTDLWLTEPPRMSLSSWHQGDI